MNPWEGMARFLIGGGIIMLLLGLAAYAFSRLGTHWRLPGDIFFQKGNFTFFFPVVTCIVISILLTILVNIFARR